MTTKQLEPGPATNIAAIVVILIAIGLVIGVIAGSLAIVHHNHELGYTTYNGMAKIAVAIVPCIR
jgi:hypothetical protein